MKLEKVFSYRNVWMGLAMLWIVWFHSGIELPYPMIQYIKSIGYGGVDIFIFASGIGCYYSLCKNDDILEFLKRRFLRIFPTYWCFLSVWLIYKSLTSQMPIRAIVGNIFCVQSIIELGYDFNWYMGAICILYMCAPFFAKLIERMSDWKNCLLAVLILLFFSFAFWNSFELIIVVTRIPVFFIGMYYAKRAKAGCELNIKSVLALGGMTVLGFALLYYFVTVHADSLWGHGLYWYPFILIAPGLCVSISYVLEKLKDSVIVRKMIQGISFVGKHSFEVYLVHIFMFEIYRLFVNKGIIPDRIRFQLVTFVLIVPMCALLNVYTNIVTKIMCVMKESFKKKEV